MALTRTVSDYKDSVKAATIGANINLAAAPNTLDGVSLVLSDRILVKDQTPSSLNGIYRVTTLGTGSNGSWTRAADFNDWRQISSGALTFVEQGTTNGNVFYYIPGGEPNVQIGTTAITFANLFSVFDATVTLQSATNYGNSTTNSITISNTTPATNTTTGALVVSGGMGIGGNLFIGGNLSIAGNTTFINTTVITTSDTIAAPAINAGTIGNTGAALVGATQTLTSTSQAASFTTSGGGQLTGYHTGAIGANSANSGAFTTLTASGNTTLNNYANIYIATGSISQASALTVVGNVYGQGGIGYLDFLKLQNTYSAATNPNKFLRLDNAGTIQIINSAYSNNIFNLTDAGDLTVPGKLTMSTGVFWSNGAAYSSGGGGSTSPGGANTMVQFNNSGSFAGATYLQYNITSGNLVSNSTTTSTSTTTGALVISGGVGIAGALYTGGNLVILGNSYIGPVPTTFNYSAAPLNLTNSLAGALKTQLNLINTGGGAGAGSAIDFYTYTSVAGGSNPETRISTTDDGNYSGYIGFWTKTPGNSGANSLVERLRVDSAGNVVVFQTTTSTSTTTGALVVNGGVGIGGNINGGSNGTSTAQHNLLSGAQNAPTAGSILVGAQTVFSGAGSNYLTHGQYPAGSTINTIGVGFGQWLQSGYSGNATYYPIILNPLGGTVVVGSGTNSTSTTSGALAVYGGIGVSGNLYVGGNLSIAGNTTFINTQTITTTDTIAAPIISANVVGNVGSSHYGTIATNAQPFITSVGTLTGLISSANITAQTANVYAAYVVANSGIQGTLITNAQTNITSVGTLTSLTTSGNITAQTANIYAGNIISNTALITTSTTASNSTTTGALLVSGGAGVGANVYVGGNIYTQQRTGYTYSGNNTSVAYTYYNATTNSIDTVFG